jgi:hypothetical protein
MKPADIEEILKKGQGIHYVIYDFECMLLPNFQHKPNLCVAHVVCGKCFSHPLTGGSDDIDCSCNRQRVIFKGENTLDEFGAWLFSKSRKKCIAIGHNAKGYDLHFLLDYIHRTGVKPEMIQCGRKIISLTAKGVKCIDSLNFLPMGLSKLPTAFGLKELSKGYFPHLFNTWENQDYSGPYPDSRYYNPEGMNTESRESFLKWYGENSSNSFNLQEELLKYCISDVDILQRACGTFRDTFVSVTEGIEPFANAVTIASACNLVYRALFLLSEQVALIPPHGYYMGKQSAIALTWLTMEEQKRGQSIRHAGNRGEVRAEGYSASPKTTFVFYFLSHVLQPFVFSFIG